MERKSMKRFLAGVVLFFAAVCIVGSAENAKEAAAVQIVRGAAPLSVDPILPPHFDRNGEEVLADLARKQNDQKAIVVPINGRLPMPNNAKLLPIADPAKQLLVALAVPGKQHGRGHKPLPPHVSRRMHQISNLQYGAMLRALPKATQATFDGYSLGCIPPIGDQGDCGDCYLHSGTKACASAQMRAGIVPANNQFMLSVQEMLDCHPELGGCGGGDEYQVAQTIQSGGCQSQIDYPGPGQSPANCQSVSGKTLYAVSSLVFVDPDQGQQGQASIQSIKNAILAYGYVSVAADAGDWGDGTSTITGNGKSVDHAIGATGWDDNNDNGDGTKGAFFGDNQWGKSWGQTIGGTSGRFKIKYNLQTGTIADSFGTEAFVAIATPVNPPTPVPPAPVPPAPPVPPGPIPPAPVSPIVVTTGFNGTTVSLDYANKIFTPPAGQTWSTAGVTTMDISGISATGVAFVRAVLDYVKANDQKRK
jgi:papain like protease